MSFRRKKYTRRKEKKKNNYKSERKKEEKRENITVTSVSDPHSFNPDPDSDPA